MFAFTSYAPAAFAGIDTLPSRPAPRQSTEEQYFRALAEEHGRAAAFARQRLQEARHHQQQRDLEAKIRFGQQLTASLQSHTPMRWSCQPHARLGRALPEAIFGFDIEGDAFGGYEELMRRRSQVATLERQKRAKEQAILRALFDEQRRTETERVAELQRKRAEQAEVERERIIRAKREQARRRLAAREAEEQKLKAFLEALISAMNTEKEEGAELERKNAIRRSSVPVPAPVTTPGPTRAPATSPSSSNFPAPARRAASPSPSVASDTSEASLHSISYLQAKYDSLRSSFEFPATLSFVSSTNSPASALTLPFNPTNTPVHAYEHALTGLLTELDAVESFGDEHVRDVRRSLARRVETELDTLEEKKREAWRRQSEPAPVESVPVAVESTPVPVEVETVPVPVELATTPVPTEYTPAPVAPTLPTTIDPANPLAWLAARLAQPSEFGDGEVKAVREGLAVRLAQPVPVVESSEPAVVEQHEVVLVEQSEDPIVEEPENLALESSESTATSQSPSFTAESQSEPESASASTELIEVAVQSGAHTSTELASPTHVPTPIIVPEPENLAETEQLAHATESESQSPVTTTTESVVAESEPEVLAAPEFKSTEPEHTRFVQVFPDSGSDVDTDVDEDLASELADRKSTSGADEFEML